jgi:hypothetical protein
MSNQRYMQRGVSASKEDVHNAIKNIDKGIFPQGKTKKKHFVGIQKILSLHIVVYQYNAVAEQKTLQCGNKK